MFNYQGIIQQLVILAAALLSKLQKHRNRAHWFQD